MRFSIVVAAMLLACGVAQAQKTEANRGVSPSGTITDGAASFAYNGIGTGGAANADLTGVGAGDQLFSLWWYYRVDGDALETPFPAPDTQDYTGNTATLSWADVDGRGFSGELVNVVADLSGPSGTLTSAWTLTNNAASPLTIDIFWYADADVAGTASGDDAVLGNFPDLIEVTDTDTLQLLGGGNSAFQVGPWPDIRDLLSDAVLDNLDDSGLPFGPGDFSGAMQWTSITIDPGASASLGGNIGVNTPAPGFGGPPPPPVPEAQTVPTLGATGMVFLVLLLVLISTVVLVRRG